MEKATGDEASFYIPCRPMPAHGLKSVEMTQGRQEIRASLLWLGI
jgi:hypothetical protein